MQSATSPSRHSIVAMPRGLEVSYLGRRHMLIPRTENGRWTRGYDNWERIADNKVAAIVRISLGGMHRWSDHWRTRIFWRSIARSVDGSHLTDRQLLEAVVLAAERRRFLLFREPRQVHASGSVADEQLAEAEPAPSSEPALKDDKKVLQIQWQDAEVWCSEHARFQGSTEHYAANEDLEVAADAEGHAAQTIAVKVSANAFSGAWTVKDVLPPKIGSHFAGELEVDATAAGQVSPNKVRVRFAPSLKNVTHAHRSHQWQISAEDFVLKVEERIEFVPGWGGQVVKLGDAVSLRTGGLLNGVFAWRGYRWMKNVGLEKKFWDGNAWQDLPADFVLADSNNFAVGFYKQAGTFTCQDGGAWPETFTDWNVDAPHNTKKLRAWEGKIEKVWSGVIDLKRKDCESGRKECCRYSIHTQATFVKQAAFGAGMIIVAAGDIRSNDALFFIRDPDIAMAAHEFGHHIGNPDEYAGAAVDTSMNGDGATKGIDRHSIMGQNMTKVKVRHLGTVAKVFSDAIRAEYGKSFTYVPVKP
jgi:hypothetical protein